MALAAWGVVLVVRGRVRQVVAVLGLLASTGVLVATATAFGPGSRRRRARRRRTWFGRRAWDPSIGPWYFSCLVAALVTLAAFAVAVRTSQRWPAMGSRYDAPTARPAGPVAAEPGEPVGELEMWRALDDGRDPTA